MLNWPDVFLRIDITAHSPMILFSNGHIMLSSSLLASIKDLWNVEIGQSESSIQLSRVITVIIIL